MLYYAKDGSIAIDDRPYPTEPFAEERRAAKKRKVENAERYERMKRRAEEAQRG